MTYSQKWKARLPKFSAVLLVIGLLLIAYRVYSQLSWNVPGGVLNIEANQQIADPVKVKIPAIGVDALVVHLGLNNDGTLEVPKQDDEVGWYVGSPKPGVVGPAIMVGHLDSARGPAVFENLIKLESNDTIEINRADGSIVIFQVTDKQIFSQDDFPSEKVYGNLEYSGLRLITCTGTYSRLKGHYSDNLVVYAKLINE